MADNATRAPKLTTEQKAETRAAMEAYRREHPGANLKEMLANLDVPFRGQLTEGMLRGLSARRPATAAAGRGKGARRATGATGAGRGGRATTRARGGRGRTMEKVITELNNLRRRRDDLDAEIQALEGEVRDRMHQSLGQEHAGRIFGGVPQGIGDAAHRAGSALGDAAGRAASAVGDRVGDLAHQG
jgi:hypothetical protein